MGASVYLYNLGSRPSTLNAGDTVTVAIATLARPWVVALAYKRADGWDRLIHDSYDNDRTGFDREFYTIEPSAEATPAP